MPKIEEIDDWINEINQNYNIIINRTIEYLILNNINYNGIIKLTYNNPRSCYVKEVINEVEQDSFGIIEFDHALMITQFKEI